MKPQRDGARIAVFRALQLGDMLCAVPALRTLRAGQPTAHITLIGLPWAASFAHRVCSYLDDFMPFPGADGFPEQPVDEAQLADFYRAARRCDFDLAIQLHGSGKHSNAVVAALGARAIAGFVPGASQSASPAEGWIRWPEALPEVERCMQLMTHLGCASQGTALEFPLDRSERDEWRMLRRTYGLEAGAYVCVHPGARLQSRRWPSQRFAAVATQLAAQGWRIVLTGTTAEIGLAEEFRSHMRHPFVDLCGRTSLGALAACISNSRLLICNDTGVSHVAAAVRAPSLVVACGSEVLRWAPLNRQLHTVIADYPPCRPCMFDVCPYTHACALAIDTQQVASAALQLLKTAEGADAA
jgi:ADP-heptose:LPS heptosyltransferase